MHLLQEQNCPIPLPSSLSPRNLLQECPEQDKSSRGGLVDMGGENKLWNVLLFQRGRGCENRQFFKPCELQTQDLYISPTALAGELGLPLLAPGCIIIFHPVCLPALHSIARKRSLCLPSLPPTRPILLPVLSLKP